MIEVRMTVRITEAELARDVHAVLAKVRAGVEIIVEQDHQPVAMITTPRRSGRKISECLALARAYEQKLQSPFKFGTLFKRFEVGKAADFFVLASLYPNITGRGGGRKASWWLPLMLVFEREEMATFMDLLQTRSGKRERMFYFGFDSPREVVLTRGRSEDRDFTCHTLENRLALIRKFLGAA